MAIDSYFYKKKLGNDGEGAVWEFLKKQGFELLARQQAFNCGELDLVVKKKDLVLFVEVKTRSKHLGYPQGLSVKKQQNVIMSARQFINLNGLSFSSHVFRFDVAFVDNSDVNDFKINYLENAFSGF